MTLDDESTFPKIEHPDKARIYSQTEDIQAQLKLDILSRPIEDAYRGLINQQEAYLRHVFEQLGVSLEYFVANYVLEYDDVKFTEKSNSVLDNEYLYQVRQTVRIRRKTPEEKRAES